MTYSAKTTPFIKEGVGVTEPPVDWVWGTGFEGRAVRPIGREVPTGAPVPDEVLETEADDFLMTENDENIQFEE
jgi:hypothetical protein